MTRKKQAARRNRNNPSYPPNNPTPQNQDTSGPNPQLNPQSNFQSHPQRNPQSNFQSHPQLNPQSNFPSHPQPNPQSNFPSHPQPNPQPNFQSHTQPNPHTNPQPVPGPSRKRKNKKKLRGGKIQGPGQRRLKKALMHTLRSFKVERPESTMNSCVTLPLSEAQLRDLVVKAKDFLMSYGVVMRTKEDPGCPDKTAHAPFMLLPSPLPAHCFEHAQQIQTDISHLMNKVAHDHNFVRDCLLSAIKNDDFTSRLWSIQNRVRDEGIKQPYELGIFRSDYMLDCGIPTADFLSGNTQVPLDDVRIKQIEVNTIASSYGGLSGDLFRYHSYALAQLGQPWQRCNIQRNNAPQAIAYGFSKAWKKYGKKKAVVLFVVQENERNIYDQRHLEYRLFFIEENARVVRKTISELAKSARLDDERRLFVDDDEVAVIYLRALYTPNDFQSERDWEVRLLLERSMAIKCPSVRYQLAGTKKVQQELTRPGVIERYVPNTEAAARIRESFASQYSLDMGKEGDATVAMAMGSPEKFVLKPQREGGGNNIFGEDIRTVLEKIGNSEERTAYVLMQRVHPVPFKNYPVISGETVSSEPLDMVSEFGVFGIFLGTEEETVHNVQTGYIMRTKLVGVDEGGVSAGFAAIDTPFLISEKTAEDGSNGQTAASMEGAGAGGSNMTTGPTEEDGAILDELDEDGGMAEEAYYEDFS